MNQSSQAIVEVESVGLLPEARKAAKAFNKIEAFTQIAKHYLRRETNDIMIIPGTKNPTLLDAGADKLLTLMGLRTEYEIVKEDIDLTDRVEPFFGYTVECRLVSIRPSDGIPAGTCVAQCVRSCDNFEDNYRWKWSYINDLPDSLLKLAEEEDWEGLEKKGIEMEVKDRGEENEYRRFRIPRRDKTPRNTILAMAQKRGKVANARVVARVTGLFHEEGDTEARGTGVIGKKEKADLVLWKDRYYSIRKRLEGRKPSTISMEEYLEIREQAELFEKKTSGPKISKDKVKSLETFLKEYPSLKLEMSTKDVVEVSEKEYAGLVEMAMLLKEKDLEMKKRQQEIDEMVDAEDNGDGSTYELSGQEED